MALRIFHRHKLHCKYRPKARACHGEDSVNDNCRVTCKVYIDGHPLKNLRSLETMDPEIGRARRGQLNELLNNGLSADEAFRVLRGRHWEEETIEVKRPITVAEAKEDFFKALKGRVTLSTYRTHDQLWRLYVLPFIRRERIELLDDFNPQVVRKFMHRLDWRNSGNVNHKRVQRLRQFFAYAIREGWTTNRNPVPVGQDVKKDFGIGKSKKAGKLTAEGFAALLRALDELKQEARNTAGRNINAQGRALAILLRFSGLRISDGVRLEKGMIQDAHVRLQPYKTRNLAEPPEICVPLLQFVLDELAKAPHTSALRFFWSGDEGSKGEGLTHRIKTFERVFRKAFERAGLKGCHSHQFRASFAEMMLASHKGAQATAEALGNTEKMVREHYSPKSDERQRALTNAVLDSVSKDATAALFGVTPQTPVPDPAGPVPPRPRHARTLRRIWRRHYSS